MWSTTLFSIRGIQVKVHATFAIIVAIGAAQWGVKHGAAGAFFGAVLTLAFFGCVLLHELGHSFVAQRFGLKVKEIVLLPIGGVASLAGKPRSPKQEIAIAIAGPLVNVAIAIALALGIGISGISLDAAFGEVESLVPSGMTFLLLLAAGNVTLALFNLLPFFPLDGGRVLRALLSMKVGEAKATRWASGVGSVAGVAMTAFALFTGQLLLGIIGLLIFVAASRERAVASLDPSLHGLRVADLAEVPAVELPASLRVNEAIPQLLRTTQEAFPVVADGRLVGVVLRTVLVRAAGQPDLGLQSIRTLTQPVPELPDHLSVADALGILEQMEAPLGVVVTPDYPLGFISHSQVFMKLSQLPSSSWPTLKRPPSGLPTGTSADLPRKAA